MALPAIGLLAAAAIWVATPWGIGIEYDSVFYWSAAENLLSGRGLGRLDGAGELVPLTHFPPLYPLTLALLAKSTGRSVADAARLASAALFGLNVFLLGRIMLAQIGGERLAIAAALVGLLAPTLVERHLWALSESLYFALLLSSLFCLVRSTYETGRRWLMAAAVAAGLASLTRYAGVAILGTGLLTCLLDSARSHRGRLSRAGLLALAGAVLPGAWQVRNLILTGTSTNRVLLYHPMNYRQLREGAFTVAGWLPFESVPAELRFAAIALLALVALAFVLPAFRRPDDRESIQARRLAIVAGLHGVVYSVFLVVSLTLFDASTRLRDRILSPLYLSGLLLVMGLIAMGQARGRKPAASYAALAVLAIVLIPYAGISWSQLGESRASGLGFAGEAWRTSETIAKVRDLPEEIRLYSNEAFPIYYLTGRPTFWIPERFDPVKGVERSSYREELEIMRHALDGGGAVLVLLRPEALPPALPTLAELTSGLEIVQTAGDGVIYGDSQD